MRSFMKVVAAGAILSAMVLAIAACGGGGDTSPDSATPPPTPVAPVTPPPGSSKPPSITGAISAPFVKGTDGMYFIVSPNAYIYGLLGQVTQDPSGIVTQLNETVLTGELIGAREISGDATFAQGRWVLGEIRRVTWLRGNDYDSYHYLAMNRLTSFASSGASLQCATARATQPTRAHSADTNLLTLEPGSAAATAKVSMSGASASVSVDLRLTVGSLSTQTQYSANIPAGSYGVQVGNLLYTLGTGAVLALGDAGLGAAHLAFIYRERLSNGNTYHGIVSMTCR